MEKCLVIYTAHNRANSVAPLDDTINYYDLTFVFSGELHYIIDGTPVVVRGGDGICISMGSHRVRLETEQETHYFSINLIADEELFRELPLHMKFCLNNTVKGQLLLLHSIREDHTSNYAVTKQSLAIQLLLVFVREQLESTSRNSYINTILNYIREHFQEHITLQSIADTVHLTVPYCCSLVKEHLGCTIYALILEERLHLAKEHILHGMYSLQEIATVCGFRDYGHFSKYFKKHIGISPSQYRQTFSAGQIIKK